MAVKKNSSTLLVTEQYRIQSKSAEFIFCPANAIEDSFYNRNSYVIPELVTNDGRVHKSQFIGTWNNRGGVYDEEFEKICQEKYGIPFLSVRSMWIGRLGRIDDFWHLIKLD